MIPGHWHTISIASAIAVLFVFISSVVFAFPVYDDCADCHGGFRENGHTSLHDEVNWNTSLMDGHKTFLGDNCDACHGSKKTPVYLNSSIDGTLSKSCLGCHGRDQDVTDSCTGMSGDLGGIEAECGSGTGLRRIHEAHPEGGNCSDCHTADPTPVGEHIAPYNYGRTGVVIQNSCDADGTESRFGATGLDNDGDGQRDDNDIDCNTPPTQPGALSASAVTSNSATVSWGASTDPDDDPISYQVDYRRNGQVEWTDGGSTAATSQPLSGLTSDQAYDVRVTPNDGTEDGPDRTTPSLFQTEIDVDLIHRDGFESN
jgi:hypothetical protein